MINNDIYVSIASLELIDAPPDNQTPGAGSSNISNAAGTTGVAAADRQYYTQRERWQDQAKRQWMVGKGLISIHMATAGAQDLGKTPPGRWPDFADGDRNHQNTTTVDNRSNVGRKVPTAMRLNWDDSVDSAVRVPRSTLPLLFKVVSHHTHPGTMLGVSSLDPTDLIRSFDTRVRTWWRDQKREQIRHERCRRRRQRQRRCRQLRQQQQQKNREEEEKEKEKLTDSNSTSAATGQEKLLLEEVNYDENEDTTVCQHNTDGQQQQDDTSDETLIDNKTRRKNGSGSLQQQCDHKEEQDGDQENDSDDNSDDVDDDDVDDINDDVDWWETTQVLHVFPSSSSIADAAIHAIIRLRVRNRLSVPIPKPTPPPIPYNQAITSPLQLQPHQYSIDGTAAAASSSSSAVAQQSPSQSPLSHHVDPTPPVMTSTTPPSMMTTPPSIPVSAAVSATICQRSTSEGCSAANSNFVQTSSTHTNSNTNIQANAANHSKNGCEGESSSSLLPKNNNTQLAAYYEIVRGGRPFAPTYHYFHDRESFMSNPLGPSPIAIAPPPPPPPSITASSPSPSSLSSALPPTTCPLHIAGQNIFFPSFLAGGDAGQHSYRVTNVICVSYVVKPATAIAHGDLDGDSSGHDDGDQNNDLNRPLWVALQPTKASIRTTPASGLKLNPGQRAFFAVTFDQSSDDSLVTRCLSGEGRGASPSAAGAAIQQQHATSIVSPSNSALLAGSSAAGSSSMMGSPSNSFTVSPSSSSLSPSAVMLMSRLLHLNGEVAAEVTAVDAETREALPHIPSVPITAYCSIPDAAQLSAGYHYWVNSTCLTNIDVSPEEMLYIRSVVCSFARGAGGGGGAQVSPQGTSARQEQQQQTSLPFHKSITLQSMLEEQEQRKTQQQQQQQQQKNGQNNTQTNGNTDVRRDQSAAAPPGSPSATSDSPAASELTSNNRRGSVSYDAATLRLLRSTSSREFAAEQPLVNLGSAVHECAIYLGEIRGLPSPFSRFGRKSSTFRVQMTLLAPDDWSDLLGETEACVPTPGGSLRFTTLLKMRRQPKANLGGQSIRLTLLEISPDDKTDELPVGFAVVTTPTETVRPAITALPLSFMMLDSFSRFDDLYCPSLVATHASIAFASMDK